MRNTNTLAVAIALATIGTSVLAAEPAAAPTLKCKKGEVLVKTTKAVVTGNVVDAELHDAKKGSLVMKGKAMLEFEPQLANRKAGDVFCYKPEDSGD